MGIRERAWEAAEALNGDKEVRKNVQKSIFMLGIFH